MEWFHFTDFHIGKPKSPQKTAMASIIDAVKLAAGTGSGHVDAVFITGDIAYSGKTEEYEEFATNFLAPLRKIPAFGKAIIFAVPGNHDVDCDACLPINWEGIGGNLGSGLQSCKVRLALANGSPAADTFSWCSLSCHPARE